jgi:hypothetical protein
MDEAPMHFGPQRAVGEPESAFYVRMAKYCWRWTIGCTPALALTIYALRQGLGDGLLWKGTIFAMLLAGFAFGMSVLAGIGFSISAGLAHICEASTKVAKGLERVYFVLATLVILPVWIFAGYQVLHAIVWQEIASPRKRESWVAFQTESLPFLLALTLFTCIFVVLPPLWMQAARATFARKAKAGTALDMIPMGVESSYRLTERHEKPRIGHDV